MSTAPTARSRVRRVPGRADYDRATIDAILDEALVCHVGFVGEDRQPYVIPTLHVRVGDVVYLHGSAASRLVRVLGAGTPACLTATLVDGLVLARSAFHHSLNYRSAVVLGEARVVESADERARVLEALMERFAPGRWGEVRTPSRQELKATRVLALSLDEASAKARTGPPVDDEADYDLPVWAGVVPLAIARGAPQADPRLAAGIAAPAYVTERAPRSS
jgi:uncharacterized protein